MLHIDTDMKNQGYLYILGRKVMIYVSPLADLGNSHVKRDWISLSNELTEDKVLEILCHEVAHFMHSRTRNGDSEHMSGEDFATLSEEWAHLVPQMSLLEFQWDEIGCLSGVLRADLTSQ